MTLNFPNLSRSYDAARHSIRFWGHDGTFEVPFSVEESALSQLAANVSSDEAGSLKNFDANRDRIFTAARKAYARVRKGSYAGSYALVASDF